ncbi:MAG: hypothetical protein NTW87_24665 [Planctomycetota bacterium]|nr:hypothetical protein [Planctomycetota bacterium]
MVPSPPSCTRLPARRRRYRLSAAFVLLAACAAAGDNAPPAARTSIIDVTDLYHPHQDCGDNLDIIAAYALPEVDLKAVILDCTGAFRKPVSDHPNPQLRDNSGPRDPGVIPMTQMNYLFGRNVPFAVGPFGSMTAPDDKMLDAPGFQQQGVELLLKTLKESPEKVEILSFGSARAIAVAYNRDSDLMKAKVKTIHLSAGASSPGFQEWNIALEPHAIVCLLRSPLPIAIYPCATKDGPFAYGPHNCFWKLADLRFIEKMNPRLRSYLAYAFERSKRIDFLRAVEEDPPANMLESMYRKAHNVWETCVWIRVANRRLVRRADGTHRLVPAADVLPTDTVLPNELKPCRVQVNDNGLFSFEITTEPAHVWIYDRGDPMANERALREALPALYQSFTLK